MVCVRFVGRFGNNIFQYLMGRILSEKYGKGFLACPHLWLRPPPSELSPRIASLGDNRYFKRMCFRKRNILTEQYIDFDSLGRGNVLLNGFFQRYEYYRPYLSEIKNEWLILPTFQTRPLDELTIHIRGGDIWAKGRRRETQTVHPDYPALPLSYFKRAIESKKWSRIEILAEDADDPMAKVLCERYQAVIRPRGSFQDDFCRLLASSNLVIPVSTFSWWAALLSNAKQIFFPIVGIFNPRNNSGSHNLVVDGDPRYDLVEIQETGPWKGLPDDVPRLLNS